MKNIFILFLFQCSILQAQNYSISKVDDSFFKPETYKEYIGESAVVEYEIGKILFGMVDGHLSIISETKCRIKILNSDGFDYATIKIPLYKKRFKSEKVEVSNATTYNFVDGKIEKTKLNSKNEILENITNDFWYTTFTMPNIVEGSVIEYTINFTSPYPEDVPEWFFQRDIPVKYSEFNFAIPSGIKFFQFIKGSEKINQFDKKGAYVFTAFDVPSIKEDKFVSNVDNYRASVIHYYNGYRKHNGEDKTYVSNWNDVVKILNEEEKLGQRLTNVNFLNQISYEITKGATSDTDKINAILDYFQQNFSWNGKIGIIASDDLETVFKNKKGSAPELNLLLTAMLRQAKINANPILLATRSKGISYMPHTRAFDNLIVGATLNQKNVYLDATNKFSRIDVIPLYNANWNGRLIKVDGNSLEVDLTPKIESRETTSANLSIDLSSNKIKGNIRNSYNGYNAYNYRNQNNEVSNDKRIEAYERRYKISIDSLLISNFDDNSSNILEYITFEKENALDIIGDKIYITPSFIFGVNENPFKQIERKYPVDFLYPNKESYALTFNIPEGYKVDYLPKSGKVATKDNSFMVSWILNNDDKKILVRWNEDYNKALVPAVEYQNLKIVYNELLKFMGEKIVLIKK